MRRESCLLVALLACAACAHVETRVMRLGPAAPPLPDGSLVGISTPTPWQPNHAQTPGKSVAAQSSG
jgi:hypothetical protein